MARSPSAWHVVLVLLHIILFLSMACNPSTGDPGPYMACRPRLVPICVNHAVGAKESPRKKRKMWVSKAGFGYQHATCFPPGLVSACFDSADPGLEPGKDLRSWKPAATLSHASHD